MLLVVAFFLKLAYVCIENQSNLRKSADHFWFIIPTYNQPYLEQTLYSIYDIQLP